MTGRVRRDIVDYALQRRALLADIRAGRRALSEACDAHPYLLLAAQHYGQAVGSGCPVCGRHNQRHVHYVYGTALGRTAGQAKSVGELALLARQCAEFDVYVVEVCPDCKWNHLVRSFVLGSAPTGELSAAEG